MSPPPKKKRPPQVGDVPQEWSKPFVPGAESDKADEEEGEDSTPFNFLTPSQLLRAKEPAEWIVDHVIAEREQCVIYASTGAGKSLISLEWVVSAALAGGVVLYLDAENAHSDIYERLCALGHCDEDQLQLVMSKLHYASFPELHALDTPRGGQQVADMAREVEADLVVIDTLSRFVQGAENDNDTHNSFARNTLRRLKGAGVASIVLDHPGKEIKRGPRGGYAKVTYVDVVWRMEVSEGFITFSREKTRNGKHPEQLLFNRIPASDGQPLSHRPMSMADGIVKRTVHKVERMSASGDELLTALREYEPPLSGKGGGRAAIKKAHPDDPRLRVGNALWTIALKRYREER